MKCWVAVAALVLAACSNEPSEADQQWEAASLESLTDEQLSDRMIADANRVGSQLPEHRNAADILRASLVLQSLPSFKERDRRDEVRKRMSFERDAPIRAARDAEYAEAEARAEKHRADEDQYFSLIKAKETAEREARQLELEEDTARAIENQKRAQAEWDAGQARAREIEDADIRWLNERARQVDGRQ